MFRFVGLYDYIIILFKGSESVNSAAGWETKNLAVFDLQVKYPEDKEKKRFSEYLRGLMGSHKTE